MTPVYCICLLIYLLLGYQCWWKFYWNKQTHATPNVTDWMVMVAVLIVWLPMAVTAIFLGVLEGLRGKRPPPSI